MKEKERNQRLIRSCRPQDNGATLISWGWWAATEQRFVRKALPFLGGAFPSSWWCVSSPVSKLWPEGSHARRNLTVASDVGPMARGRCCSANLRAHLEETPRLRWNCPKLQIGTCTKKHLCSQNLKQWNSILLNPSSINSSPKFLLPRTLVTAWCQNWEMFLDFCHLGIK